MKELELLLNADANPWTIFEGDVDHKQEFKNIVASANLEQLKVLIVNWDDHQLFNFMEDFICDGKSIMKEQEYWDFIEESGI
jgi:hypothetical protein